MDDPLFRRQRSNVVIRNIHEDYDAGCNGYAMDYRIAEQQRLFRASLGFLPHKAIYLPGEEFQATHPTRQLSSQLTLETSIDFRCSITTFMPMYISNFTVLSPMMVGFKNELSSLGTIVNDAAKACLTIYLTKGSSEMYTKLPNSGRNTVVMNFGDPFITRNSAIVVHRFDKLIPSHAISDTFNRRLMDYNVFLNVPQYSAFAWKDMPSCPTLESCSMYTSVNMRIDPLKKILCQN
ncbi:unnamed protein product [Cylicocyclus nassatus]|uniref:Uncharacterized protein n=1 Tax=Cylicocyclus nassatus TaxID=53992 RepID=A0AA36H3T0_CYLNA|nr:unnamed protein product [Cylicocyclus nassatus]